MRLTWTAWVRKVRSYLSHTPSRRIRTRRWVPSVEALETRTVLTANITNLTLATDTGPNTPDAVTKIQTPTLEGTALANATVQIFKGIDPLGTTTADDDGDWTFTVPNALGDGPHSFSASDSGGSGQTLVVTIDTDTPAAPVISSINDDTGESPVDRVTSDTSASIQGTAEANSLITLKLGGSTVTTTTANGVGDWSFTNLTLAEGTYAVTATDLAGNESVLSTQTVVVDTSAPAAPVIVTLTTDTGSSTTDRITNDTTPLIAGSAAPKSIITLKRNGTAVTTVIAGADGVWSFNLSSTVMAAGTYTVTAMDQAGNESNASAQTVVIDTTAPAIPVITSVTTDTGSSATDFVTSDTTPTITGTAVAGSTITLKRGTTVITTTTADTNGAWSFNITSALAQGVYAVTATDPAGNESDTSVADVIIDTAAPTVPTGLALDSATDSGTKGDNRTNVQAVTVKGTANASATIKLFDGANQVGTAVADANGAWSMTTTALNEGLRVLSATATDSAGNESAASALLTVTIDLTAPAAPVSLDLPTASDNGLSTVDNVTSTTTPTLTGTAEANATIKVFDRATLLGTTTASASGAWTFTSPVLADGTHTLTATATDAAGNVSAASGPLTITTDSTGAIANPLRDVTQRARIRKSKAERERAQRRAARRAARHTGPIFRQTVTITNTSSETMDGPIYLLLKGLDSDIDLLGANSGKTGNNTQYIKLDVTDLAPGETVKITLRFNNPLWRLIDWDPKLLAGVGTL